MTELGVSLHHLDGMQVHRRVNPGIKFAGTHLYTWVAKLRYMCFILLQQKHGQMKGFLEELPPEGKVSG